MAKKNTVETQLEIIQKQLERIKIKLEAHSLKIQNHVLAEHTNLINLTTNLLAEIKLIVKQNEALLQISKMDHHIEKVDDSITERKSRVSFSIEVALGAFLGVLGNFFVSLFFEPPIESTKTGLIWSGFLLFAILVALLFVAWKNTR